MFEACSIYAVEQTPKNGCKVFISYLRLAEECGQCLLDKTVTSGIPQSIDGTELDMIIWMLYVVSEGAI